jgi:toxin YoeB
MEKYRIIVSEKAKNHLKEIYLSGRKKDIIKIENLFLELEEHPKIGTGNPERLKYFDGEVWSRRINKKDRLVYEIYDDEILVNIVSILGHYE